ncbi:MAG: cytochrome c-type biogenesis CcmF C-terminal domain-containing protein, partial [Gammaproteobacteria bacterium]
PAMVLVLAALAALLVWRTSVASAVALALGLWVLLATVAHVGQRVAGGDGSLARRLRRQPPGYWGMIVAHAGVAVFTLGVALVKQGESAHDLRMQVGETRQAGAYQLRFVALERVDGPNFLAARARFEVTGGGEAATVLHPEKRFYPVQQMPMTEAAIARGFTRDLYLALGEAGKDGAWTVRLQNKPFMSWIWTGCLLIGGGGLLAASDRRYRRRKAASTTAPAFAPALATEAA